MTARLKDRLKGISIVPVGLSLLLVPFSLLIGWNIVTLILFWFILIPILSVYLPKIVSKNQNHFIESTIGLILFYAIMVFMIYKQYQTDYFQIMIISAVFNLIMVSIVLLKKPSKSMTSSV